MPIAAPRTSASKSLISFFTPSLHQRQGAKAAEPAIEGARDQQALVAIGQAEDAAAPRRQSLHAAGAGIGRRNLVALDAEARTSARRYEGDGWLLRPLRNLSCLALYFAGVPTPVIRRLYGS